MLSGLDTIPFSIEVGVKIHGFSGEVFDVSVC